MTPIERACIAVIDNLREQGDLMADCGDPEWAQVDGAFRVEPVVRAVLAAMRVPSEAMKRAAGAEPIDFRFDRFSSTEMRNDEMWQRGYADADYLWSTMIDAALQEG